LEGDPKLFLALSVEDFEIVLADPLRLRSSIDNVPRNVPLVRFGYEDLDALSEESSGWLLRTQSIRVLIEDNLGIRLSMAHDLLLAIWLGLLTVIEPQNPHELLGSEVVRVRIVGVEDLSDFS